MDFDSRNWYNSDQTSLIDRRFAQFAAYIRNASIYKCPKDPTMVAGVPRIRSYSVNCLLGVGYQNNLSREVPYRRVSAVSHPASQFAFLDENPNSIMLTDFYLDRDRDILDNLPGSYHQDSGLLSFVDGHVEAHRWLDPQTRRPLTTDWQWFNGNHFWGIRTRSKDARWLQSQSAPVDFSWSP